MSEIVETVLSAAEDSRLDQPDADHGAGATLAALAMDDNDFFLTSNFTNYLCHSSN